MNRNTDFNIFDLDQCLQGHSGEITFVVIYTESAMIVLKID